MSGRVYDPETVGSPLWKLIDPSYPSITGNKCRNHHQTCFSMVYSCSVEFTSLVIEKVLFNICKNYPETLFPILSALIWIMLLCLIGDPDPYPVEIHF